MLTANKRGNTQKQNHLDSPIITSSSSRFLSLDVLAQAARDSSALPVLGSPNLQSSSSSISSSVVGARKKTRKQEIYPIAAGDYIKVSRAGKYSECTVVRFNEDKTQIRIVYDDNTWIWAKLEGLDYKTISKQPPKANIDLTDPDNDITYRVSSKDGKVHELKPKVKLSSSTSSSSSSPAASKLPLQIGQLLEDKSADIEAKISALEKVAAESEVRVKAAREKAAALKEEAVRHKRTKDLLDSSQEFVVSTEATIELTKTIEDLQKQLQDARCRQKNAMEQIFHTISHTHKNDLKAYYDQHQSDFAPGFGQAIKSFNSSHKSLVASQISAATSSSAAATSSRSSSSKPFSYVN